MKKFILIILSLLSVIPSYATEQKPNVKQVDICVYGGTSLGVIAAYTEYCRRMKPSKAIIKIARRLVNRIYFVMKHKKKYVNNVA